MKTKHLIVPSILALIVASGCVTRTTVQNEPRQSVRFASQQAAETFYSAYLAANYPSNKTNSVAVWIGLPYNHNKIKTDNVRFNAAVQSADSDRDGMISDAEAQAYAAKGRQP